MNIIRIFDTIRYLKPSQICCLVKTKLHKAKYVQAEYNNAITLGTISCCIPKPESYGSGAFTFLNQRKRTDDWNDIEFGPLWNNNLNYMDWLNQSNLSFEEGSYYIIDFIKNIDANKRGLNSYATSLRIINWIKFINRHSKTIDKSTLKEWNNSLWSQYLHLRKNLEKNIAGNHLLENLMAIYIANIYFKPGVDEGTIKFYDNYLGKELHNQILKDGSHFEQSPMYHCVLLDRLLDCYNFRSQKTLKDNLQKMLGHLQSLIYANGDYPLFNDSAYGICPKPNEIFDYAKRLGLNWEALPLGESGYRKIQNEWLELVVDVGEVKASYQPGHTHADTLNFEARINGIPFIIDTGISTYNLSERRLYERGTKAHNCVVVDGKNSSDVWSNFRVGKRAKIKLWRDETNVIEASHFGYPKREVKRIFELLDTHIKITDTINKGLVKECKSYIHLAPGVQIYDVTKCGNIFKVKTNIALIKLEGALQVNIIDEQVSKEYNKLENNKRLEIDFKGSLIYDIITV